MGFWLMRTLNHVPNKPTFWTAARTNSSRISLSELLNLRRAMHQLNECLRGISPEYLWNISLAQERSGVGRGFCSWLGRCLVKRIGLLVKLLAFSSKRLCQTMQAYTGCERDSKCALGALFRNTSGIPPGLKGGLVSARNLSGVFFRLACCVVRCVDQEAFVRKCCDHAAH